MNKSRISIFVCMACAFALSGAAYMWAQEPGSQEIEMTGTFRVAEYDTAGNPTVVEFVDKASEKAYAVAEDDENRQKCVELAGKPVLITCRLEMDESGASWVHIIKLEEIQESESIEEKSEGAPMNSGKEESAEKIELTGEFRISEYDELGSAKALEFLDKVSGTSYKVADDENRQKFVELAGKPVMISAELREDESGTQWLYILEHKLAEEESPENPGEEETPEKE